MPNAKGVGTLPGKLDFLMCFDSEGVPFPSPSQGDPFGGGGRR